MTALDDARREELAEFWTGTGTDIYVLQGHQLAKVLAEARAEGAAEVRARVMEVLRPGCFGGFAPDVDAYDIAAALTPPDPT